MTLSNPPAERPTVVLCGSLDPARVASLAAAADWYRANVNTGTAVHVPVRDPSVPREEHARRWYALIEQADRVVVVTDPSGYIGEQTAREQAYAVQQGCDVVVEAWQPAKRVTPAPDTDRGLAEDLASDLMAISDELEEWRSGARRLAAPDTEALRQQVAAVLEERIGDNSDLYETVDEVLPLFAEREAGLRADLGQARVEVQRLRGVETASAGLVELVKQCGGWPDTGLRSHFEQLQEMRAEVERLTAELARAGARPIPDDAAERVAEAIEAVYGTYQRTPDERPLLRYARAAIAEINRTLADLGAAPATGPAPAAAEGGDR